jgi:hypothetical protein
MGVRMSRGSYASDRCVPIAPARYCQRAPIGPLTPKDVECHFARKERVIGHECLRCKACFTIAERFLCVKDALHRDR